MANINYNQPEYVSKRPRYFDGQFLSVKDFVDEQQYHIDRQRRISRFLHVSGIVDGLEVEALDGDAVSVAPGTAIDALGRQLILPKPADTEKYRVEVPSEPGNYQLILKYHEEESDPQEQQGSASNTRFHERPQPQFVLKNDTTQDDESSGRAIVLAEVEIEGNETTLSLDTGVRQYSGLYLPSGSTEGITLRAEGNQQRAVLSGNLQVTDSLEARSLNITENTALQGQLAVSGKLNAYNSLDVAGNLTTTENIETGSLTVRQDTELLGSLTVNESIKAEGNLGVDGKIGIGTSSPEANLHIRNSESAELLIEANTQDQSIEIYHPVISLKQDVGGVLGQLGYFGNTPNDNDLVLQNGSSSETKPRLILKYNGNTNLESNNIEIEDDATTIQGRLITMGRLGVGTANPEAKLHVDGETMTETLSAREEVKTKDLTVIEGGKIQLGSYSTPIFRIVAGRVIVQDGEVARFEGTGFRALRNQDIRGFHYDISFNESFKQTPIIIVTCNEPLELRTVIVRPVVETDLNGSHVKNATVTFFRADTSLQAGGFTVSASFSFIAVGI